jgi:hypothetical protein
LEPTLLDELICHISSLASVYHKPPNAFVEGKVGARKILPPKSANNEDGDDEEETGQNGNHYGGSQPKQTVIPQSADLIADLLDIGGFSAQPPLSSYNAPVQQSAGLDLLGDGLDSLINGPNETPTSTMNSMMMGTNTMNMNNYPAMNTPSPQPVFLKDY